MPHLNRIRVISTLALLVPCMLAADWPRFRGPGGSAVSLDKGLPERWSASENIVWKADLPGRGGSSPAVWGNQIFLTCFTGYGVSDEPGDLENLRRHVLCLDRATGKLLWQDEVEPKLPEEKYEQRFRLNGYASSTPATDGQRVFVFFGKTGVLGYTVKGQRLWQSDVGSRTHGWGSATSPVLYKNLVIVNASVESRSLVALDQATGKEVWRADGMKSSWNTPILVDLPGGKQELVVSVQGQVLGFDPATGEQLWSCDAINDYVCPSVVAKAGIVYAIGGRGATAIAVKAGGQGDVTDSHRLWKQSAGSNVSSPVVHEGYLYWVSDKGIAHCLNAETGEIVYQERLPRSDLVYASVTLADGKLFAVSRERGAFVLAARPQYELLAQNSLSPDNSVFNASPVVSQGQLLLRSDKALYCIGQK